MKKLILTQGVPASGKTTWAKKFVKENENWVRINRDEIREMLKAGWNAEHEELVSSIQFPAVVKALESGMNVIMDDTNLHPLRVPEIKEAVKHIKDLEIEIKEFNITRSEAIRRDALRENPVGEKVIRGFFKAYVNNAKGSETRFITGQDYTRPHAIVVDIDGTCALRQNRGYYQWHKVSQDKRYDPVHSLVANYTRLGHKIIFLTGRDESCHKQTFDWLVDNGFSPDKLISKPKGTQGTTADWKKKMMVEEIMPNYYVHFVLEDRPREVQMFRDLGLGCFQVWGGDE